MQRSSRRSATLLLAIAISAAAAPAPAGAAVNVLMDVETRTPADGYGLTYYTCFPWVADPDYRLISATGQFNSSLGVNWFYDFDQYVTEISTWQLIYRAGGPEEQVYTYNLTFNLTQADLPVVNLTNPTEGATFTDTPTFQFNSTAVGYDGWISCNPGGWDFNTADTSFTPPEALPAGDYYLSVQYYGMLPDTWASISSTTPGAPEIALMGNVHLSGTANFTIVPEPAALGAVAACLPALLVRRRRGARSH